MNSDNTFIAALENLCGGAYFSLVGDDAYAVSYTHLTLPTKQAV